MPWLPPPLPHVRVRPGEPLDVLARADARIAAARERLHRRIDAHAEAQHAADAVAWSALRLHLATRFGQIAADLWRAMLERRGWTVRTVNAPPATAFPVFPR